MIIRAIAFGLVGALLVSNLSLEFFAVLLGFVLGIALSEFLRLHSAVYLLQRRLENLESLGNLQNPQNLQRQTTANTVQPSRGARQPGAPETTPVEPASAALAQPDRPPTDAVATSPLIPRETAIGKRSGDAWINPVGEQPQRAATAAYLSAAARARRLRTPKPIQQLLDRMSTTTRIGIVVLFFGVSFLLKYAADRGVFPIEVRLLCVMALGLAIYLIGRKLQSRERVYGLLLRGAGIGIWYLCSYAAFSLYHMIGANLTFAVLVALSGFTAWNAVRHNTRAMAIFAIVGGFLAPILMSTGEGNHIALFTYYAIVNAGIVAIAYRQTWPELATIGFLFTFAIGALWGATAYRPEFFWTTEPFLLLSAAFYLAVPILFAYQVPQGRQPLYRNIVVFGTPAIALTLQLKLVSDFTDGDVWSAIAFGSVYAAVAAVTWKKLGDYSLALRDALVGIAAVFFTLAIAFAFDQQLAGAIWAVEAAGGVWLSIRQQRRWGCYLSLAILAGSGLLWLANAPSAGERLLLNSAFLQIALISLSGLVIAFLMDEQRNLISPLVAKLAAGWAAVWWLAGGAWQFGSHLANDSEHSAMGLYVLCSGAALAFLHSARSTNLAGYMAGYSMHLLGLIGLGAMLPASGPLHGLGAITWPLVTIFMYIAVYILSTRAILDTISRTNYVIAAALVVAIGIVELVPYLTDRYPAPASYILGSILPPLFVFQILQRVRLWRQRFDELHVRWISGALAALLGACFVVGLLVPPAIETGAGTFIAWPLNLAQVLVLISIAAWWSDQASEAPFDAYRARGWLLIGVGAFALANVLLLRFIHVHQGVAFEVGELAANDTVQTTLSVFWTLVGVVTVMWSSRAQHGGLWHIGMGLLAIAVGKLFLVDLAQSGTVERIVSFIAVGLLLMVVGWKSPRPRRASRGVSTQGNDPAAAQNT